MNLRFPALLLLSAACGRTQPAPQDAGGAPAQGASAGSASAAPAASSSAPVTLRSEPAAAVPLDAGDDGPYLRGASWLTCKDGFRAESTPERDLYRLGLLCGPNHGLRRLGEMVRGALQQGSSHRFSFEAKRDQCFRIMSTFDASLRRLAVRVLDPDGAQIAQAASDARWLLVDPQGAFCAETSGSYQVEVSAQEGSGSFAAQVWMLK